jgi:hypothetical protein
MTTITEITAATVTISVPLTIRRRNGRPRIVLPETLGESARSRDQAQVTLLRAIARAWHWLRQIETGEVATLSDIAAAEKVTRPFVSRLVKLAYLSPKLLERLISGAPDLEIPVEALAARASRPLGKAATVWLRKGQPYCLLVNAPLSRNTSISAAL